VRIDTFGLRIGFRSNDASALRRVLRGLSSSWPAAGAGRLDRTYRIHVGRGRAPRLALHCDQQLLGRTRGLERLARWLEDHLHRYVAEQGPRRVFVHAGAVGWKGSAVLIPGRSYSGKSTLVAALVRAGADYISDEYAVLDRRGRVHPFPAPLSLRRGLATRRLTPEALGGRAASRPIPVGWILATRYREGSRWRPRALTPGQAVLQLLAHTVPARSRPAMALAALRAAASRAKAVRSPRGEAGVVVDWLQISPGRRA